MRRAFRTDILIVAALFVLPLLFFWPVTLGGKTLLPADNLYQFQPFAAYRDQLGVPEIPHNILISDLVLENIVWKTHLRNSFGQGELPLWNPNLFAGVPFLAAGQHSGLYPFSMLYYILPLDVAYGWFTVSQLWLAGLFMFMFLRGLGIGRLGAFFGGVVFQFSNFFLASVVFQMIIAAAAWLPFLLLMVEFTIRQRPFLGRPARIPWVALGALGLGMTILAGHVEFVYYAMLVMGFWSAFRLIGLLIGRGQASPRRRPAEVIRTGGALIGLVALGMGIGAVQLVPLVELANASFREGRSSFQQVLGYALPPRHALAFLMPNIFGSPAQHDYYDVLTGQQTPIRWARSDGAVVTDSMMPGGKNYVEGAAYVGILTLALALIAVVNGLRERNSDARPPTHGPYRLILAALALVSLTFAFGTPLYAVLYYGLPGINQLHSPFRWVFPLTLCLAALAAFGIDALTRAAAIQRSFTGRFARILGIILTGAGLLLILGLVISVPAFESIRGPITSLYNGLAGANLAFPSVEAFFSHLHRNVLILGIFVALSGLVLLLSQIQIGGKRRYYIWGGLALLVILADLWVASWGFNPVSDPKWLQFTPPAIAWLQERDPQSWRMTTFQPWNKPPTLNANIPWLYGLQDIRGYDSIILRRYIEYMQRIAPQNQVLFNRVAPIFPDSIDALSSPLLNRLAVRYIVSEVALDTSRYTNLSQVYQDEAVRIYENSAAFPRAYTVSGGCAQIADPIAVAGKAELAEARNVQVTVRAETPEARCLVLADAMTPGWRAYIQPAPPAGSNQPIKDENETETPIITVDGLFRGVDLQPGAWVIRFRYSPPSFQVGFFGSFLSLAVLLFSAMILIWGRMVGRSGVSTEDPSSNVRRLAKNTFAPIILNLFNRAIDLAFAFIMLRLLGPGNAGTYYYAVVIFGWFDILTNFGLNTLLTREVARDRSAARQYLLNSSLMRLGLSGAGVPVLIAFLAIRSALPGEPLSSTAVIAIILLYAGLIPSSISTGLSALFYAFEKAEIPAAISTVTAILKAAFGLGALIAGWGVIGLAAVSILLNVITLGILAFSTRELNTGTEMKSAKPDPALMRSMLGAGWPLMLNHLLATIFFKIDVIILEPLQGDVVVGQYSTAYKWVDALGVIPSLFTMALLPIMSRQAVEDKNGLARSYHFAVKLLFSLALPTAIATTFMAEFLINLLGGARFLPDGAIALQLMIWFIPIGWINSLTNYVLIALDQQRAMRWAFLGGVSFNIIANLIFIPLYGYRAAAVITIFSEGALLIGFYLLLRRTLPPIPWRALLWKPISAGLLMTVILIALWPVAPLLALVITGIAYPVTLVTLRPFTLWERERIAALLPGKLRRFAGIS